MLIHFSRKMSGAASCALCLISVASMASETPHAPRMLIAQPLSHTPVAYNSLLSTARDPGDDDTAISLNPALSALCQSQIGQLNIYRSSRPNVDEINHDGVVLAGSQTGCSSAQNETTIAVNPFDSQNLVSGTNDYRLFNSRERRNDGSGLAYTTLDGGRTWTDVQLPHLNYQTGATGALSDMDSAGDPAIAFGRGNSVYYANLVFSRLNGASGVVVSTSRDGGLSWGDPSIVHLDGVDSSGNPLATGVFNDKEWIAVDTHSGTVYVTWTQFLSDGTSPVVAASSTDGGNTWSAPVQINPVTGFTSGGITPYSSGTIPQVGRHGELYVAYESAVCVSLLCNQATDHDAIVMATSNDGGKSFVNQEIAVNYDFPLNSDTGRDTLTGENFRINSFPQFAVDPSTGSLFVTWADDRNGSYDAKGNSIKTNGDVFIVSSRDGRNWSAPTKVSSAADEVFPAIAANHGQVAVSFYTRAYDASGINLDMAYISVEAENLSEIGGARLHRITRESENPQIQFVGIGAVTGKTLQGVFIGDYTAVALGSDGVLHPSWTDFRGLPGVTSPNQDAYTQAIELDN